MKKSILIILSTTLLFLSTIGNSFAETLQTINYVNFDKTGNDAVLAVIRLHYATGDL